MTQASMGEAVGDEPPIGLSLDERDSYPGGYVAVTLRGEVELSGAEFGAWNRATKAAVEQYWRNKKVSDECVWLHEAWINQLSR